MPSTGQNSIVGCDTIRRNIFLKTLGTCDHFVRMCVCVCEKNRLSCEFFFLSFAINNVRSSKTKLIFAQ